MKVSAIVTVAAVAAGAAAQDLPQGTDDCVVTCATNMLAKTDLGCAASDLPCLCGNNNFVYGVHDCTWANCSYNKDQLDKAMKWAADVCQKAGVPIPSITDTPAAPTDATAGAGTATASAGTPTAVTTSLFTTTLTDAGGAVVTSTGSSVLSGLNGTPGASVVATSVTAPVVATGDGFTSTLGSTTLGTSVTAGPSDATPVSSDAAESTTSSGLGARMTAAPAAGFLAAAGLAALLL
ncbi:hypothetical protein QBC39DRAFT_67635 [Podospora conica]|nr:hypothetical protein QBC39DRAFT_67635 [Schizothecium conicum]